ncbi:hypothetical protein [Paenibacillus planticolens]|uniref:Sortilin N-terminal domain-containing protein n=1 Tax=Paenibacillus planticolens TaxID=2654976 RepID=A0ABX1ZJ92_9BACL|nr:hypothetical protein [Paenibacillus planticolens]NOU99104.1 hypothetical protein [Paenibacillus planticolens]
METKAIKEIKLPSLDKDDVVFYLNQNPTTEIAITFATFNKAVYLNKDAGASWSKIAENGNGK